MLLWRGRATGGRWDEGDGALGAGRGLVVVGPGSAGGDERLGLSHGLGEAVLGRREVCLGHAELRRPVEDEVGVGLSVRRPRPRAPVHELGRGGPDDHGRATWAWAGPAAAPAPARAPAAQSDRAHEVRPLVLQKSPPDSC